MYEYYLWSKQKKAITYITKNSTNFNSIQFDKKLYGLLCLKSNSNPSLEK